MFPGVGLDQQSKAQSLRQDDQGTGRHRDGRAWRRRDRDQARRPANGRSSPARNTPAASTPTRRWRSPVRPPATTRMKTKADPTGRRVLGMLNNCAGGVTPWGTWLSCEENFHGYFSGKLADDHPEAKNFKRYGVPGNSYAWGKWHDRFDVTKEPNEANRFGWIVEIDPFDPTSTPKKRTALGRLKHEGADGVINRDGRYVVYTGDDERFDYVYKFVTRAARSTAATAPPTATCSTTARSMSRATTPTAPATGCRSCIGQGPLTAANGFNSQADVLIETRRAADLLGATKMDRPEDVEANPRTNKVYVILTNNTNRKPEQVDAANPRAKQRVRPHHRDGPAGRRPRRAAGSPGRFWSSAAILRSPRSARASPPRPPGDGWFGMPDNCAFDAQGRLWIATDGNSDKRDRPHRRAVGRRDRRRGARHLEAVLPLPGRRRIVRPGVHARRRDAVRGRPAPRRRRAEMEGVRPSLELRGPLHALARFQARHAAAAGGGRHHQARRRQDRHLNPVRSCAARP